jgi:KDO2-lipid IV(A) lauroyltransferase
MLGRRAGRAIAGLAHAGLRVRRRVVETQIRESFPDRDDSWVKRTARASYRHFGEEFGLLASGVTAVRGALGTVRDPGAAADILSSIGGGNRGAVIVTGHLGNWELAGSYLASVGVPLTAVARRQAGRFGSRLSALRSEIGLEVLDQDAGVRPLYRALRSGRCVALAADQHFWAGEPIPFLGRPAMWRLGPARLAISAGVPLVFGSLVREGKGYLVEVKSIAEEALEAGDAVTATRVWVSVLEEAVRERPEQYFWFHRRWKTGGLEQ